MCHVGAKSQTPTSEQAGPRRVTSPEVKGASATPTAETSTSLPNPLVADLSGSGSQAGAQKQGTAAHVSTDASEGSGKLYIAALENRVRPSQLHWCLRSSQLRSWTKHLSRYLGASSEFACRAAICAGS